MALAPVQLDDLSWTEMVESVRRRIAGASDGAWTHHAPVDPGAETIENESPIDLDTDAETLEAARSRPGQHDTTMP